MSQLKVNGIRHTGASSDAVTLATDGTCTVKATNTLSNRRITINGAMEVDQRNGGSSITPTSDNTYTLDRFKARLSDTSKYSVQKVSEAPSGFNSSLKVTSAAATTVGTNDYYQIDYPIEGYDSSRLDLGLSTAKQFTLSFWVKSSLTGTFGGAYSNNSGNRFYAWTYTISSANTWEKKSITITGATDGTWEKTINAGLFIYWTLGAGSGVQTSAGSWGTTFKRGPSGATNVVATNAATWQITGVQLEVGDVATDFEHRSYGDELARCQRYYQLGEAGGGKIHSGGTTFAVTLPISPSMRTTPSVDLISGSNALDETWVGDKTISSISVYDARVDGSGVSGTCTSATGNAFCTLKSGSVAFIAEL